MDGIFRDQQTLVYYQSLGLAKHLDSLAAHLSEQGYGRPTVRGILMPLRVVAEFLDETELELTALEAQSTVAAFRDYWRRRSVATYGREPGACAFGRYQLAIGHLLKDARSTGALSVATLDLEGSLGKLAQEYLAFQRAHRGLSRRSLHLHRYYLKALLDYLARFDTSDLINIPLSVLDGFIIELSDRLSRRGLATPVWVLRTFLGYLFFAGHEERDRSKEIALPQTYREMTLPKHLSDSQLEQALTSIDRNTDYGKRDWAIFMLLTCLGLRADEVRLLQLGDLNLEARNLRVDRSKGGGSQVFPLTPPLEQALRIYLEQARPKTDHQAIFVTFQPPVRPFQTGGSISSLVGRCLRKVPGLNSYGSHSLRFTLARRLRKAGAPIGIIRRTLGHRSTDTTHIYLRIAFEELQEVADNYAELL